MRESWKEIAKDGVFDIYTYPKGGHSFIMEPESYAVFIKDFYQVIKNYMKNYYRELQAAKRNQQADDTSKESNWYDTYIYIILTI